MKLVNSLKAVQSEQASKLQNKFQLESDLLEDIKYVFFIVLHALLLFALLSLDFYNKFFVPKNVSLIFQHF